MNRVTGKAESQFSQVGSATKHNYHFEWILVIIPNGIRIM